MEPLNDEQLRIPTERGCGTSDHVSRRTLLKTAGLAGLAWLTPLSQLLAVEEEKSRGQHARSVIVLWLAGGPSQLETFDPHPGSPIAHGTAAIRSSLKGAQLAAGLEQTAGILEHLSLIRSVVSKEGDHERATYNLQTGYRPTPTLVHPSIGAIIHHELPAAPIEIPTHVSILPAQWPSNGGYFGAAYDPFKCGDPAEPIPDLTSSIDPVRRAARLRHLDVVEAQFARGRSLDLGATTTLHRLTLEKALRMMGSEQVKAFDLSTVPAKERLAYGETAFARGCLAARRLIEAGVRCVEVTLGGWDTHTNNHEGQGRLVKVLDPALAALISDLKQRDLLNQTIVLCGGEFGRTPTLNPFGGRDHWPHGFSIAIAGGGIRSGQVVGATDPRGESKEPSDPVGVEDIHATVLSALGVNPEKELVTPIGRPMALSDGQVIHALLA